MRRGLLTAVVLAGLTLSSCIGVTPRDDFQAEVRRRGGGLTSQLALDAVAALEAAVGSTGLTVRSVTIDPGNRMAVFEVRDPERPENLDSWVVRDGSVSGPTPVRLSASQDLDELTYALGLVAFDRLEEMADTALEAFDSEDAYVERVTVPWPIGEADAPVILLSLASPRAQATATFTAEGEFVQVVRL